MKIAALLGLGRDDEFGLALAVGAVSRFSDFLRTVYEAIVTLTPGTGCAGSTCLSTTVTMTWVGTGAVAAIKGSPLIQPRLSSIHVFPNMHAPVWVLRYQPHWS